MKPVLRPTGLAAAEVAAAGAALAAAETGAEEAAAEAETGAADAAAGNLSRKHSKYTINRKFLEYLCVLFQGDRRSITLY
jgi:hypothetical protein